MWYLQFHVVCAKLLLSFINYLLVVIDWLADHIYHTTLGVIYLLKSKDAQTHRHSRWFLVPRTTVLGTATKVDKNSARLSVSPALLFKQNLFTFCCLFRLL